MIHIKIIEGDITLANVDLIVNAANPLMLGGGGVDGAIHRAAGPKLLEECRKIKSTNGIRCQFGEAQITKSGELLSKYVIHAVGPIYRNEKEAVAVLRSTYINLFKLAIEYECKTIAIPAISCGAYGFPIEQAAKTAIEVCSQYPHLEISFYLINKEVIKHWQNAIKESIP